MDWPAPDLLHVGQALAEVKVVPALTALLLELLMKELIELAEPTDAVFTDEIAMLKSPCSTHVANGLPSKEIFLRKTVLFLDDKKKRGYGAYRIIE